MLSADCGMLLCSRMRLVIHAQQVLGGKLRIPLCRREPLVPKQFLNRAQVSTFFQHVRAESVTERVRMDVRRESLGDGNSLNDSTYAPRRQPPPTSVDQQRRRGLVLLCQNLLPGGKIDRQC